MGPILWIGFRKQLTRLHWVTWVGPLVHIVLQIYKTTANKTNYCSVAVFHRTSTKFNSKKRPDPVLRIGSGFIFFFCPQKLLVILLARQGTLRFLPDPLENTQRRDSCTSTLSTIALTQLLLLLRLFWFAHCKSSFFSRMWSHFLSRNSLVCFNQRKTPHVNSTGIFSQWSRDNWLALSEDKQFSHYKVPKTRQVAAYRFWETWLCSAEPTSLSAPTALEECAGCLQGMLPRLPMGANPPSPPFHSDTQQLLLS